MKSYVKKELKCIEQNTEIVVEKLQSGGLSTAGEIAATELIKTLKKVKSYITNNKEADNVDFIISRLPLLYFQIPKIN